MNPGEVCSLVVGVARAISTHPVHLSPPFVHVLGVPPYVRALPPWAENLLPPPAGSSLSSSTAGLPASSKAWAFVVCINLVGVRTASPEWYARVDSLQITDQRTSGQCLHESTPILHSLRIISAINYDESRLVWGILSIRARRCGSAAKSST